MCSSVIYVHFSTTGFGSYDEVIEIGAISDHSHFHKIITPSVPVHPKASEANNFYLIDGRLYYECYEVENQCVNRQQVFLEFINFIGRHRNPILVSHNIQFFKRFFSQEIRQLGLEDYYTRMMGGHVHFADSLKIFRDVLPRLPDHQLRTVAANVLKPQKYEDCMKYFCLAFNKAFTLKNLMQELQIHAELIQRYSQL